MEAIVFVVLASVLALLLDFILPWKLRILVGFLMFLYGISLIHAWDMSFQPNYLWTVTWILMGIFLMLRWAHNPSNGDKESKPFLQAGPRKRFWIF